MHSDVGVRRYKSHEHITITIHATFPIRRRHLTLISLARTIKLVSVVPDNVIFVFKSLELLWSEFVSCGAYIEALFNQRNLKPQSVHQHTDNQHHLRLSFTMTTNGTNHTHSSHHGIPEAQQQDLSHQSIVNAPAAKVPFYTPAQQPPAGTASDQKNAPKLFQPLHLRGLTLQNRIMLSPLCQYSADYGHHTSWHFAHLGGIISRGPGLSMVEGIYESILPAHQVVF